MTSRNEPSPNKFAESEQSDSKLDTFATVDDSGLPGLLARHRWLIYVLPLAVFLAVTQLEPTPPDVDTAAEAAESGWLAIAYENYPSVYTLKIGLTLLAMGFVWPGYRCYPFHVNPQAFGVGIVGVALWIGICSLRLEERLLIPLGLEGVLGLGQRSAFNPLVELAGSPAWAWGFLAIRFFGLVVVVAVIEEFFLRGFLMRYVVQDQWWKVPFGSPHWGGIALATVAAMAMHPAEMFAELVWFSLVTWLMLRTRNIWDCVVAHGTTNLLLGLYVVGSDFWGIDAWHLL